jgi:hypothetical protein
MEGFKRTADGVRGFFETPELVVLESLTNQLIELLENATPPSPPTTVTGIDDVEALLADLETELRGLAGSASTETAPTDPALARLFPDAYRDDEAASAEFRRFTQAGAREDKITAARIVATAVGTATEARLLIPESEIMAWLTTLTNLRLTLAARLGIQTEDDHERLAFLPESDPQAWLVSLYTWLGWVQESLLAAL